ncbi:hypothetical protein [Paenibacillus endoradicis]|nr:hypothetical protein [Paenibacillus endoradicis]MCR8656729.1 hypothetical protein [Paenibacillus endoradicis]
MKNSMWSDENRNKKIQFQEKKLIMVCFIVAGIMSLALLRKWL